MLAGSTPSCAGSPPMSTMPTTLRQLGVVDLQELVGPDVRRTGRSDPGTCCCPCLGVLHVFDARRRQLRQRQLGRDRLHRRVRLELRLPVLVEEVCAVAAQHRQEAGRRRVAGLAAQADAVDALRALGLGDRLRRRRGRRPRSRAAPPARAPPERRSARQRPGRCRPRGCRAARNPAGSRRGRSTRARSRRSDSIPRSSINSPRFIMNSPPANCGIHGSSMLTTS